MYFRFWYSNLYRVLAKNWDVIALQENLKMKEELLNRAKRELRRYFSVQVVKSY